ncbi:MAG: hypothetical protein J6T74_03110 [Clostridia bacterium]|nr:hypothetical protein [Clostridia bacterium]
MRLNKEEVDRIVRDYYRKEYNQDVFFSFCLVNKSSALPCVITSRKTLLSTKRVINMNDIDATAKNDINEAITKKYPDTTVIDHSELDKIFASLGYSDTRILCGLSNGELTYYAQTTKDDEKSI